MKEGRVLPEAESGGRWPSSSICPIMQLICIAFTIVPFAPAWIISWSPLRGNGATRPPGMMALQRSTTLLF